MEPLHFTPEMLQRPTPSGIDAVTTLRHFAIITYAVDPALVRPLIHPRFDLDCIVIDGVSKALVSVVPFEDQDFRAAAFPSPRSRFGQTNYRAYVYDRATGERAVWFFGTTLGSVFVVVPRYAWGLPWHYGRFKFACASDSLGKYSAYRIVTKSRWAPAVIDLIHEPDREVEYPGFPTPETGEVVLTHPLIGYYTRRDAKLGSYSVWHDRLSASPGRVREAKIDLLDRMGLVPFAEQAKPYSVLIHARTEFLIRLPPHAVVQPSSPGSESRAVNADAPH